MWDCAINVNIDEIVYLHCHHQGTGSVCVCIELTVTILMWLSGDYWFIVVMVLSTSMVM